MKVRVNEHTQVSFKGKVYGSGEVIDVPDLFARELVGAEIATEVEEAKGKKRSRSRNK
jgi:hypothetical protein